MITNPDIGAATDPLAPVMGMEFTVGTKDVRVTSLGLWDGLTGVLTQNHLVELWDTTGTSSLGSVTVSAGTGTPNGFLYTPLGMPLTLAAGQTYRLGAEVFGGGDKYRNSVGAGSGVVISPDFTVTHGVYEFSTSVNPSNIGNSTPYIGPNFQYELVVPEPSSIALLLVGSLLCWRTQRR